MYVLYARKNSKHFLVIFLMFYGRVDPVVQKSDKRDFGNICPKGLVLLSLAHISTVFPRDISIGGHLVTNMLKVIYISSFTFRLKHWKLSFCTVFLPAKT